MSPFTNEDRARKWDRSSVTKCFIRFFFNFFFTCKDDQTAYRTIERAVFITKYTGNRQFTTNVSLDVMWLDLQGDDDSEKRELEWFSASYIFPEDVNSFSRNDNNDKQPINMWWLFCNKFLSLSVCVRYHICALLRRCKSVDHFLIYS